MEKIQERIKQLIGIFKENGGQLDIIEKQGGHRNLLYQPKKLTLNIWATDQEIYSSLVKWCYENNLTIERDIVIVKDYFDL